MEPASVLELLILLLAILVPLFLYGLGRQHGQKRVRRTGRWRAGSRAHDAATGGAASTHIDLLLAAHTLLAQAESPAGPLPLHRYAPGERESRAYALLMLRAHVRNFERLLQRAASHDPLATPIELSNALDATAGEIAAWMRAFEDN